MELILLSTTAIFALLAAELVDQIGAAFAHRSHSLTPALAGDGAMVCVTAVHRQAAANRDEDLPLDRAA
jgi:hypothetical protein